MRVLYVDDDRVNTLLFVEACRVAGGLEVETAGSGAEALDLVRHWSPELLVIDLHLPDTSGYALLPALRQSLAAAALPAILCTADDAERVSTAAQAAGFGACWTKPVAPQTIASELAQRRAGTAPGR
jgi:two-component system, OmpR family, response regulator